ncbi:MAG: response regulator [Alphaproteobacteria bacterium]|nr:response regulator [Alphaproteobacteria bacterium]
MALILAVDDDPLVRDAIARYLERDGHAVLHATDGEDAARVLAGSATRIDVVITDIFMPQRDGLEVVRSLQRAKQRPKVIAITGAGASAHGWSPLTAAAALGANTVLVKPFKGEDLCRLVSDLLDQAADEADEPAEPSSQA